MTLSPAMRAAARVRIDTQTDDPDLIARRRAQLVAAATTCFGKRGYHRTTIKNIADEAGFSPGLVYTYVREKEDVLFLVIVGLLENYAREIPQALEGTNDPLERFRLTIETYCKAVGRNVDATVLAYRETKSLSRERQKILMQLEIESNQLVSGCLEACVRAGYFRPVNLDLVTYRIVLLAHGWSLKAWHFRRVTTLEDYIREGLDLLLHGLMTPKGWRHWSTIKGADPKARPDAGARVSRPSAKARKAIA